MRIEKYAALRFEPRLQYDGCDGQECSGPDRGRDPPTQWMIDLFLVLTSHFEWPFACCACGSEQNSRGDNIDTKCGRIVVSDPSNRSGRGGCSSRHEV